MSEQDEELTGDQVYQPDPETEVPDDAGVLDPEDTLDDRGVSPALDEGYSPPERPLAADAHGVTAAEQREGQSLDERLAQELPDRPAADPDRSGRLAPDPGGPDGADDLTAEDVGISGGSASAEEAAMHTRQGPEDPPPE